MKENNLNTKHPQANIQTRLIAGLTMLLMLSVSMSVFYLSDIIKLNSTVNQIVQHPYTVSNNARDIKLHIIAMHRSMKDVVLAKNDEQLKESIKKVNEHNDRVLANFSIVFERYLGQPQTIDDAYNFFIGWEPIRNKVIQLAKNHKVDEASDITMGEGANYVEMLLSKTNNMINFADLKAQEFNNNSYQILKTAKRKSLILILAILLLGVIIFIWVIQSVNQPLNKIINRIKNIPQDQLINELPKNEKNKLALINFVFKELEDQKTSLKMQVNERTKELRRTKNLLEDAFDNASTPMVMKDFDGNLINMNQAFCNFTGYSEKELFSMKFNDLTHKEDQKTEKEYLKKIVTDKIKNISYDKRYVHKSGDILHASVSSSLVKGANNEDLYLFAQVKDITEQKQLENELIKHKAQLEKDVYNRTKSLDEKAKKLYDSQKALTYLVEDVNESRSELEESNKKYLELNKDLESFSYSVAHDLRAPLRAIDGFSKFLYEDYHAKIDDEGKRLIDIIRENTKRMDQLITDILQLSRVTRNQLNFTLVNMNELAETVCMEMFQQEEDNSYTINIEDLPSVYADLNLIKLVWLNLIGNAIKYSRNQKEKKITINAKTKDKITTFYIRDNGVGFNPNYKHKLFGVFQRLHSIEEFEGTGVGLAIVKKIVNKHGGKVGADGELGKGATFYFTLKSK